MMGDQLPMVYNPRLSPIYEFKSNATATPFDNNAKILLSDVDVKSLKSLKSVTDPDSSIQCNNWSPTVRELMLMIILGILSLMISLDATVVITSLTRTVTDLKGTSTQGFWVGTSYLLSSAVCMPFIASISDIFGRGTCLMFSLVLFAAGSLICSLANHLTLVIGGRCAQGVGGGGIIILSLVLFTDIVPLRYRSKWYGIIQGSWALGTCIGPVIGGTIAEHTTWRWTFYLMLPFCDFGFVALPFTMRVLPQLELFKERVGRVDWIGALLFIPSITSLLIAISWGGSQEPWSSWRTIVPLYSGVLGLVITAVWEVYGAKEPFFKRSLWYCSSSFAAYFGALVNGFIIYGTMYYIPIFFLAVKGHSTSRAGLDLLPAAITLAPTSVIVGVLISRLGSFRWAVICGWTVTTAATALFYLLDAEVKTSVWAALLVLLGIGEGLVLNATNVATQAICLPGDEGAAAATYAFLRSFGMALGVGASGSVFQNVMKAKLQELGLDTSIATNSEAFIIVLRNLSPQAAAPIREAYVAGIRGTNMLFCFLSALALVTSLLIKHFALDRELNEDPARLWRVDTPKSYSVED